MGCCRDFNIAIRITFFYFQITTFNKYILKLLFFSFRFGRSLANNLFSDQTLTLNLGLFGTVAIAFVTAGAEACFALMETDLTFFVTTGAFPVTNFFAR